ncbi:MAG: iron-containing alcohol dehydrogenase [Saprospiraceae bacterium]|nr:iron-containing alcohol dehydrogenase [Saprospiraceae bacterium]
MTGHCPSGHLLRPAHQGSNPISDVWAIWAIELTAKYIVRAYRDPDDLEAQSNMILASSMAGMGFGNAGVHLCHGMSYPVSGMVCNYRPEGLKTDYAIVPHGMSVILNTPAVFRFTSMACPDRYLEAAGLLGAPISKTAYGLDEAGHLLASEIVRLINASAGHPQWFVSFGYTEADIPSLVDGTLPQHRVTKLSPRPASAEDLALLFKDSMRAW